MTDERTHLRAAEIAEQLGISERTVRRWIANRTLPSVRLNGARLVSVKALEEVLNA